MPVTHQHIETSVRLTCLGCGKQVLVRVNATGEILTQSNDFTLSVTAPYPRGWMEYYVNQPGADRSQAMLLCPDCPDKLNLCKTINDLKGKWHGR